VSFGRSRAHAHAAAPPSSAMNSRRPMPDMGGPSLRDSRSLSLPPARWQVLGAGLNRSEWRRRPHLWILVLAPSPQSSSRGLGPRRPSDTLQFVARCSSLALTPSLSLAVGCLVVAPVTSGQKRQRKRTVDARERHLWPVRKGGFPWGGLIFDQGGRCFLADRISPFQSSAQLARRSSPPHPAARSSRLPIRPQRAAIPVFSRETWARDLARVENREIAGVFERGLVS